MSDKEMLKGNGLEGSSDEYCVEYIGEGTKGEADHKASEDCMHH